MSFSAIVAAGLTIGTSFAWADLPAPSAYNTTPTTATCSVVIISSAGITGPGYCGPLTVAQEAQNVMPWGQCTYWAIEKRPDLLSAVEAYRATNAADFARVARDAGFPVGNTSAVGDTAVWGPGVDGAGLETGHVAYVEAVDPDGSYVVSEMNGGFGAGLDIRLIPAAQAQDASFIGQLPPGVAPTLPAPPPVAVFAPPTSTGPVSPRPTSTGPVSHPPTSTRSPITHTAPSPMGQQIARILVARDGRITVYMHMTANSGRVSVTAQRGRVRRGLAVAHRSPSAWVASGRLPSGTWRLAIAWQPRTGYTSHPGHRTQWQTVKIRGPK